MKTRIVMWGTNEKDQKVLIAIALRAEDNVVDIYTFPFESTTEEFYNLMLNEWRESHEVTFPEGYTHITRPLTASEQILPAELKIDRSDIIQRAQTEWHFVVLSNKLYQSFLTELSEIKEKIQNASHYSNQLWEDMKETWEKVQKHIFSRTLLREHGQELREMTNDMFTQLKNMRKTMDTEVERVSHEWANKFNTRLDELEQKIKGGLGLQPLFNDLKKMQQEFKDADLSRGDRAKIWKRIDHAFKAVKEKKFGEKSSRDNSALERLNRRYEGLMSAIDKMEKSIRRDEKDKNFQDERIANTEGQLEAQIRMAKLKMIDERVNSKNEKLAEMMKTKAEIEERMEREKKYVEEQRKQSAMKEELKEAKENVKQKIADTIHAQADQLDAEALQKAADAIAQDKSRKKSGGKKKESLLGAIAETIGDSLQDVGDSIGAIASVVGDKLEEKFEDIKEEAKEQAGQVKEKLHDLKENAEEKTSHLVDDAQEAVGDVKEGLKAKAKVAKERLEDWKDDAAEKGAHLKEEAKEKAKAGKEKLQDWKDAAEEKGAQLKEELKEKLDELSEAFQEIKEDVKEKTAHLREELKEKVDDLKSRLKDEKKEEWEKEE